MAKVTNFNFGTHAPRQSPDMTLEKVRKKEAESWSRDPQFFGL